MSRHHCRTFTLLLFRLAKVLQFTISTIPQLLRADGITAGNLFCFLLFSPDGKAKVSIEGRHLFHLAMVLGGVKILSSRASRWLTRGCEEQKTEMMALDSFQSEKKSLAMSVTLIVCSRIRLQSLAKYVSSAGDKPEMDRIYARQRAGNPAK